MMFMLFLQWLKQLSMTYILVSGTRQLISINKTPVSGMVPVLEKYIHNRQNNVKLSTKEASNMV